MFGNSYTEITVLRDVYAILIPDGKETILQKDKIIFIQQILGGMFTVQTEEGLLLRVDGKDADALGQPIPDERKEITLKDVETRSLKTVIDEQLKTCYDPEIPVNIVDLGLVYQVEIINDKEDKSKNIVRIEMTLTAPACGMGEILKSDVERKIRGIPTVKYVLVDLVFEPLWDSSMMSESAKLTLGMM